MGGDRVADNWRNEWRRKRDRVNAERYAALAAKVHRTANPFEEERRAAQMRAEKNPPLQPNAQDGVLRGQVFTVHPEQTGYINPNSLDTVTA